MVKNKVNLIQKYFMGLVNWYRINKKDEDVYFILFNTYLVSVKILFLFFCVETTMVLVSNRKLRI